MSLKSIITSFLIFFLNIVSSIEVRGQFDMKILTAQIKAPDTLQTGKTYQLSISFDIVEDWHINSNKPKEEFLIPTVVQFDSLPALNIHKITYPEEKLVKFGFSETPMSVYEGQGIITCDFSLGDDFPPGESELKIRLKYQGCNDKTCLPPADTLLGVKMSVKADKKTGPQPVPQQGMGEKIMQPEILKAQGYLPFEKIHPGDSVNIVILVNIQDNYLIGSNLSSTQYLAPIDLVWEKNPYYRMESVSFPASQTRRFISGVDTAVVHVFDWRIYLKSNLHIAKDTAPGNYSIKGRITYQAYHDTDKWFLSELLDFFIDRNIDFKPANSSPVSQLSFEIPIQIAEENEPTNAINEAVFVKAEFGSSELNVLKIIEKGLFLAIIFFFIGGLLLNATPCVFPVIPITVSYFSGQSEHNRGTRFLIAFSYVIGIALVFTILGLVSGLAGKQWGFIFQNTWFVVIIVMIMLSLAASLFGAFEIRIPALFMTHLGQAREGLIGAFVMGLTIGIVIAPCAAGIIVALIILVAKLGIVAKGGALFFFMGLGLGLPYLILATYTGLLNKLPRSGMWMVWVRKLFAIIMIGVAIYFLLPHTSQIADQQSFYFGILAIFGGLFLGFLDHEHGYTKGFKIGRGIFGVLIIWGGIIWINNAIHTKTQSIKATGIDWIYYMGEDIEQYLSRSTPVFIDFYASWCAPCRKMDKQTFQDPKVIERSKKIIMIKVDCTNPDDKIKPLQDRYGAKAMPTLVFIEENGIERKDLRGVEFLGPKEFLEKMDTLF